MNLLHNLLTADYLIDEQSAIGFLPTIINIIEGKTNLKNLAELRKAELSVPSFAVVGNPSAGSNSINTVRWQDDADEANTIFVPRLIGAVSKHSQFCGPSGSIALANNIAAADENPNIRGIVLNTDTPGGEVAYTDVLADTILNTKKPFVTWGNGMVCSAGEWITAGSDYIFSSSPLDKWGSIGVLTQFANYTKYFEKKGIKIETVLATLSKDKGEDYRNLMKGEFSDYRKNTLDVINNTFHSFVKEHRNLSDDCFSGKTFLGDEAKKRGFFDEYGSLNDAILKAYNLGTNNNSKKTIYVG